uniref:CRT-like domain-containing protein n=1 Tax=Rhabditophanes sp. KR3021 TaxID=114890 RepID=A0AC35U3B3_9BILA
MVNSGEMAGATSTTTLFKVGIAVLMVTTGSLNTIAAKWADSIKSDGYLFNHPFFQAACMFLGEFACLGAYYILRLYQRRKAENENGPAVPAAPPISPFIFLPPAACDVLATSIMYIGLNMTLASSFQMLRGAVIIFTGLLSVAFLKTSLKPFKWFGMLIVCLGLVIVGVASIVYEDPKDVDINGMITGDLLIIIAQIIVAIQMVYEQKYLTQYDVHALYAVGYEGLFGLSILTFLIPIFYFIKVPVAFSPYADHRLEDILLVFQQIWDQPLIMVPLLMTVVSIALFNFAGITVTQNLSATTRMVLDSVRTLIIWMLSIPLFDEKFIPWQIAGFFFLIMGMCIYNDMLFGPFMRSRLPVDQCWSPFCLNFWGVVEEDFMRDTEALLVDDEPQQN